MTCRDKLKQDHPDWSEEQFNEVLNEECPDAHVAISYPRQDFCGYKRCAECWDREIPEEKVEETNMITAVVPRKTFDDSIHEMGEIAKKAAEEISKSTDALSCLAGVTDACFAEDGYSPVIKDSGNRTEFETGAVRDMREGKGRCDLMPLEVVANILSDGTHGDRVLEAIAEFQKSNDTKYLYSALDWFLKYFASSTCTMLLEVAKHFEDGAKKYGPDNWRLGIPVHCYIDSAVRHYLKFLRDDPDERHDRAFCWTLMCCVWEVDYREKNKEEK